MSASAGVASDLPTWVLTEGAIGMVNQALALTDALGLTPIVKKAAPLGWRAARPLWLGLPALDRLKPASDPLAPPWPNLLIACGHKSVGLALAIKRASGRRCFTVYVQDPLVDPRRFDLVIAPRHDRVRGPNVVLTRGAPNRITAARLAEARARFDDLLRPIPRPLVAVLLGGRTRRHPFDPDEAATLGRRLAQLADTEGAGLVITASRRTPPESLAAFRAAIGTKAGLFYDGSGENPYLGLLAHADAIVVTSDSVNMISDACSTGRPVLVARLEGRPSHRFHDFLSGLEADGYVRRFEGRLEHYSYAPLDDASQAAAEIARRLASAPR